MTRRRWIADEWDGDRARLLHAQAAHLARVLRAQPGQEFDIVTGELVRRGVTETVREDMVEFALHEQIDATESLPLVIGLSIVRFERMEWAMEKLTELGAAKIVPVAAQRSEKHLAQSATKRVDRWRRIARESAQQSRRSDVPEITDPIPLMRWIDEQAHDGPKLLLSETEKAHTLQRYLQQRSADDTPISSAEMICAAIGPEGGWTDAELRRFQEQDWHPVSLGSRILRTETAAIAVASLMNAWLLQ